MPRHTHNKRVQDKARKSAERVKPARVRRPAPRELDGQVLSLREAGTSFSQIARQLELDSAVDAHRSFMRALGGLAGDDRQRHLDSEDARLDQLESRIRERDAADPAKVEHRLQGVTKLRDALHQ